MLSARLGTIAIACALTLGAATGTLGCKKLLKGNKGVDAGGGKTTTTSANTPQDDADEQMLDKLDAYIHLSEHAVEPGSPDARALLLVGRSQEGRSPATRRSCSACSTSRTKP